MKKILALGLASAMVMSMGALASAKNDDALYPVGAISTNAYQYDDDASAVDLSAPIETISYGKTIYYPLLNNVNSEESAAAIAAAEALLDEKTAAYEQAVTKHGEAVTNAADKAAAVAAAEESGNAETIANAKAEEAAANALVSTRNEAMLAAETARNEAQQALDTLKAASFGFVHESDAVDGIKIKTKWEMGSKYAGSVEIAKKKVTGASIDQKYLYFVAVPLKENNTMTANDLAGTISLRKSGSFDYDEMELDVNIELSYPTATEPVITEDPQIFKEGEGFAGETDEEFTFDASSDSYFSVNTVGQSKLLLAASSDFDPEIADLYPDANLDFFYGNGATFNKTGTLYLAADGDAYLYKVNEKGNLEKVDAQYDEYDEAFAIRTKTLGKYVISDIELDLIEKPSNDNSGSNDDSNVAVVPNPNPSTGAAA